MESENYFEGSGGAEDVISEESVTLDLPNNDEEQVVTISSDIEEPKPEPDPKEEKVEKTEPESKGKEDKPEDPESKAPEEADPENLLEVGSLLMQQLHERYGWEYDAEKNKAFAEKGADGFFEFVDKMIEHNSTPEFQSPMAKRLEEFVSAGGTESQFLRELSDRNPSALSDENVLRMQYEHQGYSKEEIDELMDEHDQLGNTKKRAETARKWFDRNQEEAAKAMAEQQRKYAEEQEAIAKKEMADISNALEEYAKSLDYKFAGGSKGLQQRTMKYFYEPDQQNLTDFAKDLRNPKVLAFIAAAKDVNYDISKFTAKAIKTATTDAHRKLSDALKKREPVRKISGGNEERSFFES